MHHRSAVADFVDRAAVEAIYRQEIIDLVGDLSGADLVLVNSPGILRFSERSAISGKLDNSRPGALCPRRRQRCHGRRVRPAGGARGAPCGAVRALQHLAGHLGAAAGRAAGGMRRAHRDAGRSDCGRCRVRRARPPRVVVRGPRASRTRRVIAGTGSPTCTREEALVFKTHDSDLARAHCVPHVAFDNPPCRAGQCRRARASRCARSRCGSAERLVKLKRAARMIIRTFVRMHGRHDGAFRTRPSSRA